MSDSTNRILEEARIHREDTERINREKREAEEAGTYKPWRAIPVGENDPALQRHLELLAAVEQTKQPRPQRRRSHKQTKQGAQNRHEQFTSLNEAHPEIFVEFVQAAMHIHERQHKIQFSAKDILALVRCFHLLDPTVLIEFIQNLEENRKRRGHITSELAINHELAPLFSALAEKQEPSLAGFFTSAGRPNVENASHRRLNVGKKYVKEPRKEIIYQCVLAADFATGVTESEVVEKTGIQRETVCGMLSKLRAAGRIKFAGFERDGRAVSVIVPTKNKPAMDMDTILSNPEYLKIYNAFLEKGEEGSTAENIYRTLGYEANTGSARVTRLKAFKHLANTGRKAPTRAGNRAEILVAVKRD